MKKLLTILLFVSFSVGANGLPECQKWDTFCKNPAQIIATKCRLGVPVKHEQCKTVQVRKGHYLRAQGSLVEGFPYTTTVTGQSADQILDPYIN